MLRIINSLISALDYVEIDNLTQAVNDIEMEMKGEIQFIY